VSAPRRFALAGALRAALPGALRATLPGALRATLPGALRATLLGALRAALLGALLGGCAKVSDVEWESPVARGHPLVNRVWDVKAGAFVGESAMIKELAASRWVLLGERHDNADHHVLQVRVVRGLVEAGRRPVVGFEMLSTDDAAALARFLARGPKDAAELGDAVNWARSGWPEWRFYQPIAQVALDSGLTIVATNLSRAATDAVRRNGLAGLGPTLTQQLRLDEVPSPETREAMTREVRDAHCGQTPENMLDRMVDVQWARDARMAASLARAGGRDGAVLIAGVGHTRNDRGVPAHLARHAPGTRAASVAFLEVDAAKTSPADYAAAFDGALPFDFVWFTPRVDDTDPCDKFKRVSR
jgi:uncharacterized iron-regulated protein